MGQKDLYQSDFYEDNRRFADVFNGVLFEGKEIVVVSNWGGVTLMAIYN